MKTFLKILLGIITIALVGYFLGPKPAAPNLEIAPNIKLNNNLAALETQIATEEKAVKGIRPGCEAKIVWCDNTKKEKTKLAILYIHGFSASQMEGDPVHKNVASKFGANLYLARLAGHGIDRGDSTMIDVTADDFVISAEHALAVAKTIGEEVVIIYSTILLQSLK